MNDTSYTDRLLEKEVWFVVLLQGQDDEDNEVFHYIAVRGENFDKFMGEQEKAEFFDPDDYGVIIDSGFGTPEAAFKTRIVRSFKLAQIA